VPSHRASELIKALKSAGYKDSAVIGKVIERKKGDFAPLVLLVE
jgi:hydrogenase maturation factor